MRTFLTAARTEFARITATRMSAISLIALMFIPIVYGGLYLWGNKDPYAKLDRVPAALVVDDRGATIDGERRDLGREAADEVLDARTFDWRETSGSAARAGVASGRYDFALIIPADFSRRIASASGTDAVRASLRLVTDDTNSYLSTTIAGQAAERIGESVARKVGRDASLRLLDGVSELRGGLVKGADGAATLRDGAASAESGAQSLADGTAQLRDGSGSLAQGLGVLKSSTAALPGQTSALASGAQQVSSGVGQVGALAAKTRDDVEAALATAVLTPEQRAGLNAELDALASSTAPGSPLATGAARVADGAGQLSAGSSRLASGVASAEAAAGRLESGAGSAATGAAQLASGAGSLQSGAEQLRAALQSGADRTASTTASERAATAKLLADPIEVKHDAVTKAADYGAGLAPFFISLAGWIGIYALFLLVRPLSRRALTAARRPVSTALAGWAVPAGLGVVQMLGLFAVVAGPLGLQIANPLGMVAFMALVSAAYAAIVLALNVWLGSVGQFLGLLLMVVQLVTAGGTFPWQTLPGPLAALHRALPMAHAVDGIRALMYGGSGATLEGAAGILALWLVLGLAVSVAGAVKQGRFRTLRELRPSAIGA